MSAVLQGVISPSDGLREALEIVMTLKDINSGVLEIRSSKLSGRIGVAWGRFITGATLDSGERGKAALRTLLSVRSGRFSFVDTKGEPIHDLRQSLGIDLNGVAPYVPHNLEATVTPWLYETDEQVEAFAQLDTNSRLRALAQNPSALLAESVAENGLSAVSPEVSESVEDPPGSMYEPITQLDGPITQLEPTTPGDEISNASAQSSEGVIAQATERIEAHLSRFAKPSVPGSLRLKLERPASLSKDTSPVGEGEPNITDELAKYLSIPAVTEVDNSPAEPTAVDSALSVDDKLAEGKSPEQVPVIRSVEELRAKSQRVETKLQTMPAPVFQPGSLTPAPPRGYFENFDLSPVIEKVPMDESEHSKTSLDSFEQSAVMQSDALSIEALPFTEFVISPETQSKTVANAHMQMGVADAVYRASEISGTNISSEPIPEDGDTAFQTNVQSDSPPISAATPAPPQQSASNQAAVAGLSKDQVHPASASTIYSAKVGNSDPVGRRIGYGLVFCTACITTVILGFKYSPQIIPQVANMMRGIFNIH